MTDEAGSVWALSLATSSGNLVPSSRPMQISNQSTGGHLGALFLKEIADKMTLEQKAEAQKLAREWKQLSRHHDRLRIG